LLYVNGNNEPYGKHNGEKIMGFPWKQILTLGMSIGSQVASTLTGNSMISTIPQIVVAVENAIKGKATSEEKKATALEAVLVALTMAESVTRKDLVDNDAAMSAIDRLIDDIVALENAIHWKNPI
jgi:hypothetical protein